MADQANIFGSDKTQPPASNTSGKPADSSDNPLAILVGEGRKYKSPEELAKAYIEADSFIEKLKVENAEARAKLAAAKTIDDVLQRIEQPKASTQDKGEANNPQGLTADAIAKIVRDTVTGLETQKSKEQNLLRADAAMKKLFGEKAGEVYAQAADTPEKKAALISLASVDPDKFVKLFSPGDSRSAGSQTDSGSSVNSAALADTNASARAMDPSCKEFYDAMRRDPKRRGDYYSAANQLAMHKAAVANPEKYFGRKIG